MSTPHLFRQLLIRVLDDNFSYLSTNNRLLVDDYLKFRSGWNIHVMAIGDQIREEL